MSETAERTAARGRKLLLEIHRNVVRVLQALDISDRAVFREEVGNLGNSLKEANSTGLISTVDASTHLMTALKIMADQANYKVFEDLRLEAVSCMGIARDNLRIGLEDAGVITAGAKAIADNVIKQDAVTDTRTQLGGPQDNPAGKDLHSDHGQHKEQADETASGNNTSKPDAQHAEIQAGDEESKA